MTPAPVNPVLVRWARECSAIAPEDPVAKFKWLSGVGAGRNAAHLKQVEALADKIHDELSETFAGRAGVSICERVGPRDGPPGGKS